MGWEKETKFMNVLSSRAALIAMVASLGADVSQPITNKGVDPMPRGPMPKKVRITAGPPESSVDLKSLISVCRGGSHGIFRAYSDHGMIEVRKPFDAETILWTPEVARQSAA